MRTDGRPCILVVDNDPDIRAVISIRLERRGFECVQAGSGAQALGEWRRRSFDLVVSDLNMPGGDGVALADALLRAEHVPIVFVTGFRRDFNDRLAGFKHAIVVEKPFDAEALIGIVEKALLGSEQGDDGLRHPLGADV